MFSLFKKVDGWCVALWIGCLSIALYAIWISFPWLHQWVPSNSAELASWVQAIGSIGIIGFTWFTFSSSNIESRRNEEIKSLSAERAQFFAVINTLNDLKIAMANLEEKMIRSEFEKIKGMDVRLSSIELTLRTLQSRNEGYRTHSSALIALREISYTKVAISEMIAGQSVSIDRIKRQGSRRKKIDECINGLRLTMRVETQRLIVLLHKSGRISNNSTSQ